MKKNINYLGSNIFYIIKNNKKPVIMLLHGFGFDASIWDEWVQYLQKNYTLILPELPGFGGSDIIEDLSIDKIAEIFYQILKKENIEKCVMVGHSMGGYAAAAFADKYSEMLNMLVMFHSTTYSDSTEKKEHRNKVISFIQKNGKKTFLDNLYQNLFAPIFVEKSLQEIEKWRKKSNSFSKKTLIECYKAMMNRPSRQHILQKLNLPIVYFSGQNDNAVPAKQNIEEINISRMSKLVFLENVGHMGMLEAPIFTYQELKKILDDLEIN